jgi:hypothetical protein
MTAPTSLEKLHWIVAEERRGPEAWRAAWLAAIDRAFPYNEHDHDIAQQRARHRALIESIRRETKR